MPADINTCFATTDIYRNLALYSHLIPALATFVLGFFAYLRAPSRNKAGIFFAFSITFGLWLIADLLNWVSNGYHIVAATWAPLDYINIVFFLLLFCFAWTDLLERPMPPLFVWFIALAAAIPLGVTLSGNAVFEMNLPSCEMLGNNFLAQYKLGLEIIILAAVLIFGISRAIKKWKTKTEVIRALLVTSSIVLFMGIFSGAEFISTLTNVFEITLYSLFTLPIFVLILTIAITSFGTFRLGDTAVKVLFYIFLILAGTQFFFVSNLTDFLLAAMSFVVVLTLGIMLYITSEREIQQRVVIGRYAEDLGKANDKLKELDRLKSQFLSIASHDLRAPLTVVRNFMSLLMEGTYGTLPAQSQDGIRQVFDRATEMSKSVDNYLNVSRIEQRRMTYDFANTDLVKIVSDAVSFYKPNAEKKGLTFMFRAPMDLKPIRAKADAARLSEVVGLLIDNAIKYTPKGNVQVSIEQTSKEGKAIARITVKDSGVGITKDTMPKLFQLFSTGDESRKVNISSSGVGLYVVKAHVEAHKGRVWAESDGEGKGSTFIVELPASA